MLLLLTILLIVVLVMTYIASKKEVCSPGVLFVAPFVVMCVVALMFQKEWSFELGVNTFFVVLIGNITFCIGTYIGNMVKLRNCGSNCTIDSGYDISGSKYILLCLFQCFCYSVKVKYIVDFAVSNGVRRSIPRALGYYNNMLKFTTEATVRFPSWLTLGLDACSMLGFVFACLLAHQIITKGYKQKTFFLILVNFVVAFIGGSTSGGRGGSVQVAISFLCAYLILYQRKNKWIKPIPVKKLIVIFIGLLFVAWMFFISMTWLGRSEALLVGRYLSNYIGAQIFNLDYLLNYTFESSVIFGQETFYPLIERLSGLLGISQWSNFHIAYENVYAAGYNTGNVYTCFYSYVKDFGFLGVVLVPVLFGVFCQIMYRYARNTRGNEAITINLIFYSNLAYMIAFAFFADKLGSMVFTFNMAKKMVLLYVIMLYLYNFDIKKGNIILRKKTIQNLN